jgi:hypothetical protein
VPNITNKKPKSTPISNMIGNELRIVETRPLMPGIELIVRKGLRILMTLMAETFCALMRALTQPRMTTMKSSYIKVNFYER